MKPMKTISLLLSGAAVLATSATMVMAQGAYPPLTPLGEPPIPSDNQQTDAKVELGKILFWDPRLGGDASTACVTCHELIRAGRLATAFRVAIRARCTGVTANP